MAGFNRYYYPTKYNSRAQVISLGVKCIFISHQKSDTVAAKKVADYLIAAGIDVYFDEYDGNLKIHHQNKNPKEVTKAICNGINNSSHMIIVVSPNTLGSSWVPFEIGYGYERTELGVLCLKGIPKGALPEYIRSVPIVRDIYDLNNLISKLSEKPREMLIENRLIGDFSNPYNSLASVMDGIIAGDV